MDFCAGMMQEFCQAWPGVDPRRLKQHKASKAWGFHSFVVVVKCSESRWSGKQVSQCCCLMSLFAPFIWVEDMGIKSCRGKIQVLGGTRTPAGEQDNSLGHPLWFWNVVHSFKQHFKGNRNWGGGKSPVNVAPSQLWLCPFVFTHTHTASPNGWLTIVILGLETSFPKMTLGIHHTPPHNLQSRALSKLPPPRHFYIHKYHLYYYRIEWFCKFLWEQKKRLLVWSRWNG